MQFFIILLSMVFFESSLAAKTAYTHFNWVRPETKTVLHDSLLIEENGVIQYIGENKKITDDITVVDLSNKYVISGFIDTHTHVTLGAVNFKKHRGQLALVANNHDDISEHNGKVLLAYGITDVRNPGGDTQGSVRYKRNIEDGIWLGPDAYVAGELLDQRLFKGLSIKVTNKTQINEAIAHQKSLGVDFIKLYTGLNEQLLQEAINSAHRNGLKAVAHLDGIAWDKAAEMGLDAVVHAMPISEDLLSDQSRERYLSKRRVGSFNFFEWYEEIDFETQRFKTFIKQLVKFNLSVDPTLIVFHNAFWGNSDQVINHPQLNLVHPELVENWKTFFTFNVGWKEEDYKRAQSVWPKVELFIRQLYTSGVLLTVGTDMNNPWVIPGVSFHQEMELLVNAGIPIFDVLLMATLNGAKAIDQTDKKGSLAINKFANFVVLNKDPSQDIAHTQSIYAVVKKGQLFQPNNLLKSIVEQ